MNLGYGCAQAIANSCNLEIPERYPPFPLCKKRDDSVDIGGGISGILRKTEIVFDFDETRA